MVRLPPRPLPFPYTTLFRSDDRHVAAQDVPELRQLVEVGTAQEPSERRHARIGRLGPHRTGLVFGIVEHRSELRSEEHTSELQSLRHLVCRLLLEKKKLKQS